MGREIHYSVTCDRPFTVNEMKAGEQVVLAFNELFKDGGRLSRGLFNFEFLEGATDGAQFFTGKGAVGSTKPYGEVPALFLYGGLAALSKVFPSAVIEIDDEGVNGKVQTVADGTELKNGRLTNGRPAAAGVIPCHWVSEINALRPRGMKAVTCKSTGGGLLASQVPAVLSEIGRVIRERVLAGPLQLSGPSDGSAGTTAPLNESGTTRQFAHPRTPTLSNVPMKKGSLSPVRIGKAVMIPVTRFYNLKSRFGKGSVQQSVRDAVEHFGAIFQGETDVRLGNGQFGKPFETGYCNFLMPVDAVNDFNAHWSKLADAARIDREA